MRSKSTSIPLLQWQITSHVKSCGSLWVTNQRIHFTFLYQDLYTGLCILHLLGFTMDLLNLQAVQTNRMHRVSPAQPSPWSRICCLFTKWFSEKMGRRTPSPGEILALPHHMALKHRPPCWAVLQETAEDTPLS